ncbi:uncharacterized protein KQ657_001501 [Scheffersomyces spartinae]|uniref:Uncharacterized protein n=1 Tax=Scheffersomyces spartinae TaxID=45513 RepID=A0A9P8AHI0_9ASCO|nr:uncharacterized protein KQ657_001501 [Scheffersomyces spartinae]KAG7192718.1 hypothetical protein KQ657_001501 [Scheffersomyces spartinae]
MKFSTATILAAASAVGVNAADAQQVDFLTALVSDLASHRGSYLQFVATFTESVPAAVTELALNVQTYTDNAYTTLLEDTSVVEQISKFATALPWYSSLAAQAAAAASATGSASGSEAASSTESSSSASAADSASSAASSSAKSSESSAKSSESSAKSSASSAKSSASSAKSSASSAASSASSASSSSSTGAAGSVYVAPVGAMLGAVAVALL